MKRRAVILGNWKMYKTIQEAKDFFTQIAPFAKKSQAKVGIAAPYTTIHAVASYAKDANVLLGAQNVWDVEEGAFTGEISALMLKDAGAQFVLIGHSERRKYFHENNALISRKMTMALRHGLTPVLCIGETQEEREKGLTTTVLKQQIEEGLAGFSPQQVSSIILAYEPVWAIGTGKSATPEMADEAHLFCRTCVSKKWGEEVAQKLCILYGGSVTPQTSVSLLSQEHIDGALIGGASLKVDLFSQIINSYVES